MLFLHTQKKRDNKYWYTCRFPATCQLWRRQWDAEINNVPSTLSFKWCNKTDTEAPKQLSSVAYFILTFNLHWCSAVFDSNNYSKEVNNAKAEMLWPLGQMWPEEFCTHKARQSNMADNQLPKRWCSELPSAVTYFTIPYHWSQPWRSSKHGKQADAMTLHGSSAGWRQERQRRKL